MFSLNPEFKRQLWLNLSTTRLILAPVVIAVVTALLAATDRSAGDIIHSIAWGALGIVLLVWGSSVVGASVRDELSERTWNQQRMSRITPWQMTWGKLFGSASYVWYIAAFCAAIAAVYSERSADEPFALQLVRLIAFALFVQTVAITVPLSLQQDNAPPSKIGSNVALIVFGFFGIQFLSLIARPYGYREPAIWYGIEADRSILTLLVTITLALWGLLGAWRAMRSALQVRQWPWAFPVFIAFYGAFLAGFWRKHSLSHVQVIAVGISFALAWATWLVMIVEPQSLFTWKRVTTLWAQGDKRRAVSNITTAASLFVCAMLALLITACLLTMSGSGGYESKLFGEKHFQANAVLFVWLALLLLRDAAFAVVATTLVANVNRRFGVMLIYLLALHVALPAALKAMGRSVLATWFPGSSPLGSIAFAIVTLALSIGLLVWRVKRIQPSHS